MAEIKHFNDIPDGYKDGDIRWCRENAPIGYSVTDVTHKGMILCVKNTQGELALEEDEDEE